MVLYELQLRNFIEHVWMVVQCNYKIKFKAYQFKKPMIEFSSSAIGVAVIIQRSQRWDPGSTPGWRTL